MRNIVKHIGRVTFIVALIISGSLGNVQAQSIRVSNSNPLLFWANKLLQNINAQNTKYRHKDNVVTWGDDPATTQCYTDCSGFINSLVTRSFQWQEKDFETALGHKRMYAYHYYDAITWGRRFAQIKNISGILPGDIIALKYASREEHDDNTGHVMLIVSQPRMRNPTKVFEPNTSQYEIEVIDCSKSPHGKKDTRRGADGNEYSGLGKGIFRLYADQQGNIVGYSWSTGNPKEGFNPFENPIVVGRLMPDNNY